MHIHTTCKIDENTINKNTQQTDGLIFLNISICFGYEKKKRYTKKNKNDCVYFS